MSLLTLEDRANKLKTYGLGFLAPLVIGAVLGVLLTADDELGALTPLFLGMATAVALTALRAIVGAVLRPRLGIERATSATWWCYGAPDELVRLLLVLLLARDVQSAVLLGLGWGVGECVVGLSNLLTLAGVVTKDDPKSMEAKQAFWSLGFLTPHHPLWASLEGLGLLCRQLGFTLLLLAQPWSVLVTVVLHSAVILGSVRFTKRHFAVTEVAAAAVSMGVLTVASWLTFA
jgi:hypothetical protein